MGRQLRLTGKLTEKCFLGCVVCLGQNRHVICNCCPTTPLVHVPAPPPSLHHVQWIWLHSNLPCSIHVCNPEDYELWAYVLNANSQHANSQHANSQHANPQHPNSQHANSQHANSQHANPQHANPQHANSQHANSQHANSQHRRF